MTYKSEWWSVDLPPAWFGCAGVDCTTFRAQPPVGVLQISAARNEANRVTDGDLREFAEARFAVAALSQHCAFGSFCGFTAEYRSNGLFWRERWLRSGQLMVYVTNNVREEYAKAEQAECAAFTST
jgi:hypothetical protein